MVDVEMIDAVILRAIIRAGDLPALLNGIADALKAEADQARSERRPTAIFLCDEALLRGTIGKLYSGSGT
jgi:hypothetical protein